MYLDKEDNNEVQKIHKAYAKDYLMIFKRP